MTDYLCDPCGTRHKNMEDLANCCELREAVLIGGTMVTTSTGGNPHKDRWECPHCREDMIKGECRWNLSSDKRGKIHKCRFCKNKLYLPQTK